MPGVTHNHIPNPRRPLPRKHSQPPYLFKTTTTPYGLNEPQWSVGPPPLQFELSPYARIPLPPLPPVELHDLLLYHPHNISTISWMVHQPPTLARLSSSSVYANAYHWKALPAFAHGYTSSSLTIRIASAGRFTRPIIVFPSNQQTGIITIGDVLNAIYRGLRQCANDVLCESMQISPSLISEQLSRSHGFPSTQSQFTGEQDDEVSAHVADILSFQTQWVGLTPSDTERDVFVLYTKALTPR